MRVHIVAQLFYNNELIINYFYQQPLKPGIGQYSSTSAADADETPFLEMCIGKFVYSVMPSSVSVVQKVNGLLQTCQISPYLPAC